MRAPLAVLTAVFASTLASSLAAAVTLAAPAQAVIAVDTTGTTYDTAPARVAMTFPVAGPTSYTDTWLTCRSGCARKHMGQDLMGVKMTPLVAAFDGVVSSLGRERTAGAGNSLVITGDNGWSAVYLHVNNDTPGTDDGRGTEQYAFPRGIEVGTRVLAGQLVAWRGDSGNAESTGPHLHFELRRGSGWSGIVVNAFPSLQTARRLGQPLSAGPHPDQSLVRSADGTPFVYDGATKHPVTPGVLLANGLDLRAAVTVRTEELRRYQTVGPLPLRAGALVSDPTGAVWRITPDGRYAATPVTGQRVAAVATSDLTDLPVLEVPALPTAGMLVRKDGTLSVLGTDGALHGADASVLASWGLTAADATDWPAPDVQPEQGASLGLRDGTLVAISAVGPAVISHGTVRRIWDRPQEIAYGYLGLPRLRVPSRLLAGLATGELAGR